MWSTCTLRWVLHFFQSSRKMAKKLTPDLSGQTFGRYTVLHKDTERRDTRNRRDFYICQCACGNVRSVNKWGLIRGTSKSCGCLSSERMKAYDYKHGLSRTRLYHIYHQMRQRCYNSNYSCYGNYGGRGIRICEEWLEDPIKFINWSIENGYNDSLTIDRIDVNGNYEPNNCRWATRKTQQRNKTNSLLIVFDGVERSFADVCDELGVKRGNAWQNWLRYKDKSKLVEYIKRHAISTPRLSTTSL